MNTQERPRTFFSSEPQSRAAYALNLGKKAIACSLAYLMIPLGMGDLYAQNAPPPPPDQGQYADQGGPPPGAYNPLSPDQLNQLVAPIALYPDSLVAQILAASTYPSQVADADHFLQANQGASPSQLAQMVDSMNWDPSVKALIAFPSVLNNLDRNLDWTSQLGNAYYNQPQDVMSAVQDMRQRAYDAGNLKTDQQMVVQYQPSNIVIAPANPTVVYVPYYNPWVVYGAPIVAYPAYYPPPQPAGYFAAGLVIGFGIGIAVASYNRYGWGWNSWGMGWHSRTVVYNRNVYVSRSVTVVNHGYYGHYDRNVAARNYNRNVATTYNRNYNNYNKTTNTYNKNVNTYNRNTNTYNKNNNTYNKNNNTYNKPANTNYNKPNNNVRPAENYNRPNTSNNNYNNRPANTNYNKPNNNVRPAENYNRPNTSNNTYNKPNNNYNKPAHTNYNKPQGHPQGKPQSKPASHPQNNNKKNPKR
jgi:Protein of unknown function (DUF3300)